MSATLRIKNSTIAGRAPSSLALGELAINTVDGKLYYGDGNTVKLISSSGSIGSGTVTSIQLATGTGIGLSGTNPITTTGTITITNTAPDQTVTLGNGTGISVTGTYPNFTITNTDPDQTVVFTNGAGISVTGTYPNFTITNTLASSIVGYLTTSSFNNWTGSNLSQFAGTSSFASTASYVNPLNQTVLITGSIYHSGSLFQTGSVGITGSTVINNLTYPTVDGTFASQVLQTDAVGNLTFGNVETTYDTIYNAEATTLVKGTPVYVSGSQGANPKVYRADASDPNKMPVIYIVSENIATASTGRGITLGHITGIDLTGYTAGTSVYVASGGGWTATRPTGSAIIQFLGLVTKGGNGGQGLVLNPGPITLPNLTSGSLWVGNSNSIPTAVTTSSLSVLSALTASYIDPNAIPSFFQIVTGSISTKVDVNIDSLFLIKSGSQEYLKIARNGDTTVNSSLFVVKDFTTQQPVLTVSQSIVQVATHSLAPTGTTVAGGIWFTPTDFYVGLE